MAFFSKLLVDRRDESLSMWQFRWHTKSLYVPSRCRYQIPKANLWPYAGSR